MALYDPTGHALLSAEAKALTPAQLTAYANAAEADLGLVAGLDPARATLAVVWWINCRTQPSRGRVVKSESNGNQSVTYADGASTGDPCRDAYRLAGELLSGAVVAGARQQGRGSGSLRNEYVW